MGSLLRVACAVAIAAAATGAMAKDRHQGRELARADVKHGVGIICDSAQQVERYLRLSNGDASLEDAVHMVNTESKNPRACGIAAIAFTTDEQIGTINIPNGIARIMRVRIVGTVTPKGWEPVPVTIQYTALLEPSEDV